MRRLRIARNSGETQGDYLVRAREYRGVGLREMARSLGFSHQRLLHWETNRSKPRATVIVEVAAAYGVHPLELAAAPLEAAP